MLRRPCSRCKKSYPEVKFNSLKVAYYVSCNNEIQKEYAKTDKGKANLHRQNLKQYGLTVEDYQRLLINQNSSCAICDNLQSHEKLSVDHDHSTGKVRGLLCRGCNTGLGHFKDNIELLKKAIKYLKKI